MAVEYEISSDVATVTGVASNTQVASIVKFYTGSITYDDEPTSKYASVTINGKTQRVMLCVAVSGTAVYDDVPCLYSTVSGHRTLNVVEPTESGTPDDVPSLYETVVVDGKTVRALRCVLISATPNYDGVSSTCTFTDNGKTHTAQLVNQVSSGSIKTIVKGVSPLSLPDAIADSLSYVKAFGGTEQRNLPAGYTELQYIESTGTQYIDTGVTTSNDMKGEIRGKFLSVDTTSAHLLSARQGGNGYNSLVAWNNNGDGGYFTQFSASYTRVVMPKDTNIHILQGVVTPTSTSTYVDSSVDTISAENVGYNQNLYINARNIDGTSVVDISTYRYYYVKIWKSGSLVRDFVPAKNASGVVGMYDTVSGTFFTNKGTGDFVAGPDAVPTPDAPMDIVSNNGVLKVSPNLFKGTIGSVSQGTWSNGTYTGTSHPTSYKYWAIRPRLGNAAISTYPLGTGTGTISQTITKSSDWDTIEVGTFNSGADSSIRISLSNLIDGQTYTVSFNAVQFGDVANNTFPIFNNIQVEKGSTATTYHPYGSIYTEGAGETIADSANHTATVETLFAVGDYADEQNINTGVITRKVGVKVLDGTENWGLWRKGYATRVLRGIARARTVPLSNITESVSSKIELDGSADLCFYNIVTDFPTVTDWKRYIADQYAAGTPVIVIYPLATPTTESVTGQTLQVQAGDNTLEITQASLPNLELEAKYSKSA